MLKQRLGPGWTLKRIEEFFDDQVHDREDLDENARRAYDYWLNNDVPEYMRYAIHGKVDSDNIPYNVLDRETVITYAHFDIVLTLEVFAKLEPIIKARQNEKAIQIENRLILPFYEMEREGFDIDEEYLHASQLRMKQYILERRAYLFSLCGVEFKLGQHALIKNLLEVKFDLKIISTRADELTRLVTDLKHSQPEHPAIPFIDTIQELRTLEKWYSTYVMRFV
jgi:DNA polymerase I-like protein with 3'-5' exonuclease and polymerase domains